MKLGVEGLGFFWRGQGESWQALSQVLYLHILQWQHEWGGIPQNPA